MRSSSHPTLFASHVVGAMALLLALSHDGGPLGAAPPAPTAASISNSHHPHVVNRSLKGDRLPVAQGTRTRTPVKPIRPVPQPSTKPPPVGCEPPFSPFIKAPPDIPPARCITGIGTAGDATVASSSAIFGAAS
jgi:hypothetical protein